MGRNHINLVMTLIGHTELPLWSELPEQEFLADGLNNLFFHNQTIVIVKRHGIANRQRYLLQFIDHVFHILGPFLGSAAVVEGLPGNGLSNLHREGVIDITVHLVDQEQHGDIHLEVKS